MKRWSTTLQNRQDEILLGNQRNNMVNSSLNWGYEFIFLFLIHTWKYAHLGKKYELEKMLDNKDNLEPTFHRTLNILPHLEYQFS